MIESPLKNVFEKISRQKLLFTFQTIQKYKD